MSYDRGASKNDLDHNQSSRISAVPP